MSSSQLGPAGMDIEPDLNKAPPHIEGELLKQKDRVVIGRKKGWKKYFFVVYRDKLHYYHSVQDYKADKDPIAPIRLSHVLEITEAMFSDVPGRHYTNCGFTIVVIPPSTEKREFNLLAETPDQMRSWIRNLRYTKAYWSMKDYRETVISVDQERMLLDRLLREEEDQKDVLFGDYDPDDDFVNVEASKAISVHFASGSTTLKIGLADQAGEVIERVSDRLSSSSAQLWVVNYSGKETPLDPAHDLHPYHPSSNRFYALDPVDRLLVVFIASLSNHVIIVENSSVTAQEIISNSEVSHALDLQCVVNRGLFLSQGSEEHLFAPNECPCEVLHKNGSDGKIERQSVGYLIVKNRSHSGTGSRSSVRATIRHTKLLHSGISHEYSVIEEDQEEAQSKALAMITEKLRSRGGSGRDEKSPSPSPKRIVEHRRSTDAAAPSSPKGTPEPKQRSHSEDPAIMNRTRSGAIRRGGGGRALPRSPQHHSPTPSPISSPANSPLPGRRFPLLPPTNIKQHDDQFDPAPGPSLSVPYTRTRDRSPSRRATINTKASQNGGRRRAPTLLQVADTLNAEESRSSTFGSVRHTIDTSDPLPHSPQTSLRPQYSSGVDESERLEHLFSASYSSSQSDRSDDQPVVDSLTSKIVEMETTTATSDGDRTKDEDHTPPSSPQGPMVIDFDSLKRPVMNGVGSTNQIAPVEVHTPSILKIVLLQAEATPTSGSDPAHHDRAMDVISLSGVVLHYSKGAWQLAQGSTYHEVTEQSVDKIEGFTLRGGVRALYSHTKHCWYVLQPLAPPPDPAQSQSPQENANNERSLTTSGESATPADIQTLYLQKRAVTTEIGSAFHEILHLFSTCKTIEEKKRVGSDMTNLQLGYLIRGRLCSALAWLLLDGVKVQLFGGLVTRDVWKIVSAFVQDGIENEAYPSVHSVLEGQVLRPIRAETRLSDNHIRFRSFVCLAISRGVFVDWLTQLPERRDTLKKYYSSTGLLPLASSDHTHYRKLFDEILLSLQPITVLPLELSIDFEIKQSHTPPRENHTPPTSGSSFTDGPIEPVQRPAAIDTTPTSLVNLHHQPDNINPQHTTQPPVVTERGTSWQPQQQRPAQHQPQATPPATPTGKTSTKTGSTWLQKLSYNLANLDMGGSLTGTHARQLQQRSVDQQRVPVQQPMTPPVEVKSEPRPVPQAQAQQQPWSVQAVHSCYADKSDELSFTKGDVFTARYRINDDWLLCQQEASGTTKVGIVPSNFVKSI